MIRYLRLLKIFFKTSLMADLEYRFNFILKLSTELVWYVSQLLIYEVLFQFVDQLAGWDLQTARVFMGFLFIIDALYMLFFSENVDLMTEKVKKGELDLVLVKPISSQFLLSFVRMNTVYLLSLFCVLVYFIWALFAHSSFNPLNLVFLPLLVFCSLSVIYSLRFFFASLGIIFVGSESIQWLWFQLYRLSMRPHGIYPDPVRILLMSLLPMAFIASVPAELILDQASPWYFFPYFGFSFLFFLLSQRFFKFALTRYASASS